MSLVAEFDVKAKSQEKTCSIVDFCILDDGSMVIVDTLNHKLKRLDQGYNLKDMLPVYCNGLCKTGPSELAYLRDLTVQFVHVGRSMIHSRSFKISDEKLNLEIEGYKKPSLSLKFIVLSKGMFFILVNCFYISSYFNNKSGHIILLCDFEGCHLQTIDLTSWCTDDIKHFSLSQDGTRMFIAMGDKGLIMLNRNGQVLFEVTDERLQNAFHVSEEGNGQIYVCGKDSGNLLLVDKDGKVVSEVLGRYDGLGSPISSMYIRDQKRLLVACEKEDSVKIFQM